MLEGLTFSEEDFLLFRSFIHEKFGIYFKDEKRSFIETKLAPQVMSNGFPSFKEYIQFLKWGTQSSVEVARVMSLLTNNETYFFRELPQLMVFRDTLLPALRDIKAKKDEKRIRIMSAGCSTGEEVYTISMLVFQSGIFFWDWDVQIIGMDISERALGIAQQGIYYDRSFRVTDNEYKKKFFSYNAGSYHVKDNIKKNTSFVLGNISDPATWFSYKNFDILLCRNVLIYFSEEKIKMVVNNFYQALGEEGCLLLGHSENMFGIPNQFILEQYPETTVYRKKK